MKPSTLLLGLILPFLPLSSYAAMETARQQEQKPEDNASGQIATFVLKFEPASLAAFLEAEKTAPSDPIMEGFMKDEYPNTALHSAVIFLRDYRTVILHMAHPDADIDEYSIAYPEKELVRILFSGSMAKHAGQWCRMFLEPPSLELLRLHPDNEALLADRNDSGEIRHIPEGYRLISGNGSRHFLVETPETAKKHGRYLSETDVRDAGPCFFWRGFYINLTPGGASKMDKLIQDAKTDRFAIVLNNYVLAAPKARLLPEGFLYMPDSSLNLEMTLLHGLYSPKNRHANSLRFTIEQEPVFTTIRDEDVIFTWDGKPLPGEQASSFVLKITGSDSDDGTRQEDALQWVKLRLSCDAGLQDNIAVQPEGRDGLRILLRRDAAGKADSYMAALLDSPLVALLRVHPDNEALLADRDAQGKPRAIPEGYRVMNHVFTDENDNQHIRPLVVETPEHAEKSGLLITNAHMAEAHADYQRWGHVNVTLSEDGGQIMRRLTQPMEKGRARIAIVCMGRVVSAPIVQDVLYKEFSISGLDAINEANRLVRLIRLGNIRFTSEPGK